MIEPNDVILALVYLARRDGLLRFVEDADEPGRHARASARLAWSPNDAVVAKVPVGEGGDLVAAVEAIQTLCSEYEAADARRHLRVV